MQPLAAVTSRVLPSTSRYSFHHVGFVVSSIQEIASGFGLCFGAEWDGRIIHDPSQMVRVSFLHNQPPAPLIELVEPTGRDSPISRFLQTGGGLHHLCYEVDDLEAQLEFSWSVGAVIVKSPTPAVAFAQRRVAWVYTPKTLLLEYLER